jgi:hypothetical protein
VIEAISKASNIVEELRALNQHPSLKAPSDNHSEQSCNISWTPPSKGYFKINVDAHRLGYGR